MLHSICHVKKQETTNGWAKPKEVQQMGLLPDPKAEPSMRACYVGGYPDDKGHLHYLQHAGAEHIIAFAPTRSGKGVGLVLPTLLGGWRESVVVHDTQDELYALTAGYRQKIGNRVLKFNPSSTPDDPQCCHFNPLDEVRIGTEFEIADVQNIAAVLADPYDEGFFSDNLSKQFSFSLFASVILHVLYTGTNKTLQGVAAFLMDMPTLDAAFESMLSGGKVHPFITQVAKEITCRSDGDKTVILYRSIHLLKPYVDPVVSEWTAYSDFRITDLQDSEKPITLFLVRSTYKDTPWGSEEKECAQPLIRLLMRLLASRLTAPDRLSEKKNGVT